MKQIRTLDMSELNSELNSTSQIGISSSEVIRDLANASA